MAGQRAGKCCEHFQPFSRVDSDLKRCAGATGNRDITLGWAGEQNYENLSGSRPEKQCSLDLPEPGKSVRKEHCVNWRLILGTGVMKGQLCPLENKLEQ